jgi:hypothetical protein
MKRDEIICASAVIFLGIAQLVPCMLVFCGGIVQLLGFLYCYALAFFWGGTNTGRRFVTSWYHATLRIEYEILGANS